MANDKKHLPATREPAGLVSPAAMPEWMRGEAHVGNENVSRNDVNIPRIGILQALSPELDPSDVAKYLPDAKIGQIINTLTKETTATIKVVNCYFEKQYGVFRRRKEGGGFRGVFPTLEEAISKAEAPEREDDAGKLEVIEQDVHYILLIDPTGQEVVGEAALVCTSTKFKVSRNWNSLISMQKGPRFGGIWDISTVSEKNAKGSFFNFRTPAPAGWASQTIYEHAKAFYEAVSSGAKKVVQERDDHVAEAPEVQHEENPRY